jgi:hypothetical protein
LINLTLILPTVFPKIKTRFKGWGEAKTVRKKQSNFGIHESKPYEFKFPIIPVCNVSALFINFLLFASQEKNTLVDS